MRVCRRLAVVRRQVKQLAAVAAERAAQADGYRGDDRFRLLTEAETELILDEGHFDILRLRCIREDAAERQGGDKQ